MKIGIWVSQHTIAATPSISEDGFAFFEAHLLEARYSGLLDEARRPAQESSDVGGRGVEMFLPIEFGLQRCIIDV